MRYHINALMGAGMTTALIADLASVPVATIRSLRRTATRTITPTTADATLSVTFHPSRGRDLTPAVGARRRLRALNAMGYGDPALARRLNVEVGVVTSMPEKGLITSELWEAVREIYDELSMRPGPDTDLREQSRAAGLVSPLGWDDDEIDNPRARSHERERATGAVAADDVVIVRRLGGEPVPMRNCERKEILRMAYEQRWSPSLLADTLAIKYDSAVTELSRYRRALVQTGAPGSGSADSSTEEIAVRISNAPTAEREKDENGPAAAAAELTTAHNPDSPRKAEAMSDGIQSLGHRQAERASAGVRLPGECDRSQLNWRPRSTRKVPRGDDWLCSCGTRSWGARIWEQATPAKPGDYAVTRSDVAWPADRDRREPPVLNRTALGRMSAGNRRPTCRSSRQRWHPPAERTSVSHRGRPRQTLCEVADACRFPAKGRQRSWSGRSSDVHGSSMVLSNHHNSFNPARPSSPLHGTRRRETVMHESFSSALNEMSVADAVMQLASGTVELALEEAPECGRWCWFADLLDSDWGLTGRLPATGGDVVHELERVAGMCRTSGKKTLNPDAWRAAYEATESMTHSSAVTRSDAAYLALSAANDIALECLDEPHPEFTVAIALAFESLAACTADSTIARCWITRALTEWTNRTHPVAGGPHGHSAERVDSLRQVVARGSC